jgi:hypothetical protein
VISLRSRSPGLPVRSLDTLRPPSPLDPDAAAYKDWLHLTLVDHGSELVGLVNVSLHGGPEDPRSRALGAAVVHLPGVGWCGNVQVVGLDQVRIGRSSLAMSAVALAVDHPSGTVRASAHLPSDGLSLRLAAHADVASVPIERRIPLGPGWISWYVMPHLLVEGEAVVGGRSFELTDAVAYSDHNWGRWHWGDDLGWECATLLSPAGGPSFVITRITDRAHRTAGDRMLIVHVEGERRTFAGPAVQLFSNGRFQARPRRMPGAMAALHQDRAKPRLPATVRVEANDGVDGVVIEFVVRAASQLIAADPARRGYGFVHELPGRFSAVGRLRGRRMEAEGLGVFEYVE